MRDELILVKNLYTGENNELNFLLHMEFIDIVYTN